MEELKQEHLSKKHNEEGYYNEECELCVSRKNGEDTTPPTDLGVDVSEEVKSDEHIG